MYVEPGPAAGAHPPGHGVFPFKKLMDGGGLLPREQYYTMYSINKKRCSSAAFWTSWGESSDAQRQQSGEARYRQRVLDSFLSTAALRPSPPSGRRSASAWRKSPRSWSWAAPERELNQVLLRFHQDYCTPAPGHD